VNAASAILSIGNTSDRQKMSRGEVLLLCSSVASLIISCIIWSARKQAWMDEIFTWNEVSDRSLWHLYYAIQHGADGGQPLFYTTAWVWAKTFGTSVLSLRLYSCACMCGALLVTWRCIRRVYGLWATAFGVLWMWGSSGLLLDQNAEARFYGLFVLAVAVAVDVYLRLAAHSTPTRSLLIYSLIAQAALVLSHVLGLLYSGMILLALVLFDVLHGRFRIKVYLFHAAGWLALLVWIPAILASMAAGKPYSWIPVPTFSKLFDAYFFWDYLPWLSLVQRHVPDFLFQVCRHGIQVATLFPVAVVLSFAGRKLLSAKRSFSPTQEDSLLLVAFALLLMPIVLFVVSHLLTPVFVDRYLLPSGIGISIILAAFANRLSLHVPSSLTALSRLLSMMIAMFLVACPVASALLRDASSVNYEYLDVQRLDKTVSPDTAVIVGWQHDFSKVMRYSQKPGSHYYFLLDWSASLAGPRTHVLDYHLMRAYHDTGYYPQRIQDGHAFLCSHADFLVLDAHAFAPLEQGTSWFDFAIRNNPTFRWEILDSLDGPDVKRSLIAVHRSAPLAHCDEP
jgi:hypothetical protein